MEKTLVVGWGLAGHRKKLANSETSRNLLVHIASSWQEDGKSNERLAQGECYVSLRPWKQWERFRGHRISPPVLSQTSNYPPIYSQKKKKRMAATYLQTSTPGGNLLALWYLSDIRLFLSWVSHQLDAGLAYFLCSPPKHPCLQEVGRKSISLLMLELQSSLWQWLAKEEVEGGSKISDQKQRCFCPWAFYFLKYGMSQKNGTLTNPSNILCTMVEEFNEHSLRQAVTHSVNRVQWRGQTEGHESFLLMSIQRNTWCFGWVLQDCKMVAGNLFIKVSFQISRCRGKSI